jgi:hypothetical protein
MSKICDKCRTELPDGSLAYEVKIQVAADFDGHLPEAGTAEEVEGRMRELASRMEQADADKLMRDVFHQERYLLCPGCRERYLANPLNLPLPGEPS